MTEEIRRLIRPNILKLTPYSSARSEFAGDASIYLDANENPYDNGYNRYPDPLQGQLKALVSDIKGVPTENIFIGNGSDEAIDLCFRTFCRPGVDNAISFSPTYGMYEVAAEINDVEMRTVPLNADFTLPEPEKVLNCTDSKSKLLFICSPNNPTGNAFAPDDILQIAQDFMGIVVVDEAYIDFSSRPSMVRHIYDTPNIIVLQTLSKAWGMAGLRVGFAFADKDIISVMNSVKYPYNVNVASRRKAIEMLSLRLADKQIKEIVYEREKMCTLLADIECVKRVYPSDANFLLVETDNPKDIYKYLLDEGVVVRDRSSIPGCEGCLRITIGTPGENSRIISLLRGYQGSDNQDMRISQRKSAVHRSTRETDITVKVDLDGIEPSHISTGIHFLNHMLDQIVHHGGISLDIKAKGDLEVDTHHTIEDTAITLGEALYEALGDKRGIERYGFTLPMDECRAQVLIDLGGRIDFDWDVPFTVDMVGDMPTEMFKHFFKSLCAAMKCNLHIIAKGENNHHLAEAVFKAFARALRMAVYRRPGNNKLPSSKGELW